MSGYYPGYDQAGFSPQSDRAWRHSHDKRAWDEVSDSDAFTNTHTKRPRLVGAALNRFDYTVGWVCALHHEMAAAEAMLDDRHPPLKMNSNDSNVYTFGRIGPHNVVIACLPAGKYGTNSAAVVANNMRWSFPSIHIGLMVGIGGGVPGKVDIRLGDVVVSNPTGISSGVVQYDFGKAVDDGRFERTGTLNKPPESVLAAVAKLRANHEAQPSRIPAILADMEKRNPYMSGYFYKNMDEDRLFQAFYEHAVGDTCDDCDISKVVERHPRPMPAIPKIHYGIIASGNQVMKHAQTRDRLAQELDLICFEMEAAGLMDNFPCLVVRGICDYSDSHKAKRWQRYAAATAAAYAKELLYVITPHGNLDTTAQTVVPDTVRSPPPAPPPDHRKILLDSLKFDQIDKRQANIKAAHAKTCEWLIEHPDYTAWMDRQKYSQHHGFLWIRGKPGAGKSTLMNFAFLQAKRRKRKQGPLVSFFFNARGEDIEKTTLGMYRSLLHQLFKTMPDLQTLLDDPDLTHVTQPDSETWDLNQLQNLFRSAVRRLGKRQLTCFIDALDECNDNEVSDMVKCFEDLGQYAVQNDIRFYVCFSSRHYPYIDIVYGQKLVLEDQIGHGNDLQDYVRSKLKAGSGPKSEQVIAEILRKASCVFMWVVLVVDILNKEYQKGRLFAVEKRLKDIPSELSKLFQDILTRDQENMDDLLLCIQLLLYSRRSLTREEYYFAIASGLQPDAPGEWDLEDITHEFMDRLIVSSSKGLAEATRSYDRTVQFIHESVRDFLLKDGGLRNLWPHLGDDFEGRSHDRLKDCCHTYLTQVNIIAYLPEDKFLLKTSAESDRKHRTKVAKRFPFLEYATNQVLHHAEAAATHGIPQNEFCRRFTVDHWIQMNNSFEKAKVRRHKPDSTSLLYIAAAKGLTKLVKTVLVQDPNVNVVGGRYTYPLLAAISEGHEQTANALLDFMTNSSNEINPDPSSGSESRRCDRVVSSTLDRKDKEGHTALYYAAQRRELIDIAQRLLKLGASPAFYMKHVKASPLVRAAEKKNEAFARLYLRERARSQSSLTPLENSLTSASSNEEHEGEEGLLKLDEQNLLSPGIDSQTLLPASKTCDEDVSKALLIAAGTGNEDIAKLLLHSGAEIHAVNDQWATPLHIACQHNNEAVVKLLLNAGAGVNRRQSQNRTPLHYASINGSAAVLKLLIENGADLESVDRLRETPLHDACTNGYLAVAEALVEAGANLQARTETGATPLHLVCLNNRLETANFLIEAGADVEATNNDGKTPLFYAVQQPQMVCLDVLLSYGANINHRDDHGRTPLFEVINNSSDDFQKFLDKQPDLNIADHSGQTALLELQAIKGEIAKLLVEAGVNVAWRNNAGQTFLHAVCSRDSVISDDYLVFVQEVVKQSLDVDARDNTGRTPLLDAVKGGNANWIPFLIQHGANPDAADDHGWTPLSTAIEFGSYWRLTKLLLGGGADPTKTGPNGEGLLDMAARLGKDELLEPLRAAIEERGIAQ